MEIGGVIILDFGSQYTKLIARRVREENIYSKIFPHNMKENYSYWIFKFMMHKI